MSGDDDPFIDPLDCVCLMVVHGLLGECTDITVDKRGVDWCILAEVICNEAIETNITC